MKHLMLGYMIFGLSSCILSTWDNRLKIVNNSAQNFRYIDEVMEKDDFLLDTVYCQSTDPYSIPAGGEDVVLSQTKWEYLLRTNPEKVLRIFIVNEDSLLRNGLCKVMQKQIFFTRFDLTYDDLEQLNWRLELSDIDQ